MWSNIPPVESLLCNVIGPPPHVRELIDQFSLRVVSRLQFFSFSHFHRRVVCMCVAVKRDVYLLRVSSSLSQAVSQASWEKVYVLLAELKTSQDARF